MSEVQVGGSECVWKHRTAFEFQEKRMILLINMNKNDKKNWFALACVTRLGFNPSMSAQVAELLYIRENHDGEM